MLGDTGDMPNMRHLNPFEGKRMLDTVGLLVCPFIAWSVACSWALHRLLRWKLAPRCSSLGAAGALLDVFFNHMASQFAYRISGLEMWINQL